jgi:hypothetical protein
VTPKTFSAMMAELDLVEPAARRRTERLKAEAIRASRSEKTPNPHESFYTRLGQQVGLSETQCKRARRLWRERHSPTVRPIIADLDDGNTTISAAYDNVFRDSRKPRRTATSVAPKPRDTQIRVLTNVTTTLSAITDALNDIGTPHDQLLPPDTAATTAKTFRAAASTLTTIARTLTKDQP